MTHDVEAAGMQGARRWSPEVLEVGTFVTVRFTADPFVVDVTRTSDLARDFLGVFRPSPFAARF